MQAKANLTFSYKTARTASLAAELLEIDNRVAPSSLKITSKAAGKTVTTQFSHPNFGTFALALEDIIFTEKLISELLDFVEGESNA